MQWSRMDDTKKYSNAGHSARGSGAVGTPNSGHALSLSRLETGPLFPHHGRHSSTRGASPASTRPCQARQAPHRPLPCVRLAFLCLLFFPLSLFWQGVAACAAMSLLGEGAVPLFMLSPLRRMSVGGWRCFVWHVCSLCWCRAASVSDQGVGKGTSCALGGPKVLSGVL